MKNQQPAQIVKKLTGGGTGSLLLGKFHKYAEKLKRKKAAVLNEEFLILQCIAILTVIFAHGKGSAFTFLSNWFVYGSFHMPLFIFISGYFYKTAPEQNVFQFIWKKCKTLLFPYFIWNFIYGIFVSLLLNNHIVTFPKPLSFRTIFIAPWLAGTHFGFNCGGWFVLSLFLVEIVYLLLRKFRSLIHRNGEWLFGLFLLSCGMCAVFLANSGYSHGVFLPIIKMVFFLPAFHFGYLYRVKIEPKEKIPGWVYFSVIFAIQLILLKLYGTLTFYAYNATFIHDNLLLPYLTTFTGGLFWLRVSKILARALKGNRIVRYMGQNTWSIMMHHPISFFSVNCLLWCLSGPLNLSGFNFQAFQSNIWYTYSPNLPQFAIVYVVAGVALPLLVKYGVEKLVLYLDKRTSRLEKTEQAS